MYAFSTWLNILSCAFKPCTNGIHVQSGMNADGTFGGTFCYSSGILLVKCFFFFLKNWTFLLVKCFHSMTDIDWYSEVPCDLDE